MSIISHLDKGGRGARTPVDVAQDIALATDGTVLTGEQSAVERIVEDAIVAERVASVEGGSLPDGVLPGRRVRDWSVEQYSSVDQYDPVLASHCRLDGKG